MENQEQEINLAEIFFLLLSKIKFIILLTLIGGGIMFAYAKFWLPLQYSSAVSIYVKNSAATDKEATTASDLTAAKSLASTYIVILDDDAMYDEVSEMLLTAYGSEQMKAFFTIRKDENGKEYIPASQIRKMVTASTINNTEVIQIKATTKDPLLSADICNDIAQYAKTLLTKVTHAGYVETIGQAKVPTAASGPNIKRYTIIGAFIGFILAAAIVIIMKLLDNRINNAEEIKTRFSIPVLGEIPDLEMGDKEASKYEY